MGEPDHARRRVSHPVDVAKPRDEGPPIPLTPELYTELLSPHRDGEGL